MLQENILYPFFRLIGFRPEAGETLIEDIDDSIGELEEYHIYRIEKFTTGDDFSNCASVLYGNINTEGCIFQAIEEIPAVWKAQSL